MLDLSECLIPVALEIAEFIPDFLAKVGIFPLRPGDLQPVLHAVCCAYKKVIHEAPPMPR